MIDLNDALARKFTQEDIAETIKSGNIELTFKLALQFIFTTDRIEFGWHLLNSIPFASLIDEKFIKDLLDPNQSLQSFQVIKFLHSVIKQDTKELNMAIQKHLATYIQQKPLEQGNSSTITLQQMMELIEMIEKRIDPNSSSIVSILKYIIKNLAITQIPRETSDIKTLNGECSVRIVSFFQNLQMRNEDRLKVLVQVYEYMIAAHFEPQPLIAYGFLIIPNVEMITPAIEHFFNILQDHKIKIREPIVRAMSKLIQWCRTQKFDVPLELWIDRTISLLKANSYNDIIDEIALENILPAFISMVIPVFQNKMFRICQILLLSASNTKELFDKIQGRCLNLLKNLEETKSKIFEQVMELICETLATINQTDIKYKPLLQYMEARNYSPSKYVGKRTIGPSIVGYLSRNARVGLENLGNTCYLNSILQALFMTKQFCREILVTQRFEDRSVLALQELFALMLFSPRPEQSPKKVVNYIRPDDFLPGIQHDSSEFLGSLLDRLHELEKKRLNDDRKSSKLTDDEDWDNDEMDTTNQDSGSSSSCSLAGTITSSDSGIQMQPTMTMMEVEQGSIDKIIDNTTADNVNFYHTYIQKIFGGKMSTRYLCSTCNGKSINIDSFRDLQLSFPEKTENENESDAQYKVQQLLEFYFTTEELNLSGDNQYHCDNCKILCDGFRCTEILEPPRNLILTLKHFRYDSRHHTRSKLLYKVYHDEIITVNVKGSFSSNSTRSVEYKLYAAVIHSGTSLDSGHYFTIARESENKWFKFNDSFVTKSSLDELTSLISPNTPYILFYQRLSTASSTIVHSSDSASCSSSSLSNSIINENSFPEYEELSSVLRTLIDDDKNQFELEMARNQQSVPHHTISSRHNPDNDGSGSSGYDVSDFPRYIY